MTFPTSPRVIYDKNTLEEVICQFRFPSILKVTATPPVEFQERVRGKYPLYQEVSTTNVSDLLPGGLPTDLARLFSGPASTIHDFRSEDSTWRVTLSQNAIALTCYKYRYWEAFQERFSDISRALLEIYAPAFYSRIGLRYKNVIRRSLLDLGGTPWQELLQSHITGELGSSLASNVRQFSGESIIKLSDENHLVRIRHGLADQSDEVSFVIDSDFFTEERTPLNAADSVLEEFHGQSGKFFRWCIHTRLHDAMGPRAVG